MQLADCTTLRHQLGRVLVSDETEYALGAQLAAHIDSTQKSVDIQDIQRYVKRISALLVKRAGEDRIGVSYRFTALDDPAQVNAFVAGVLAHETIHIVGRHSANQLASQLGLQLISVIA